MDREEFGSSTNQQQPRKRSYERLAEMNSEQPNVQERRVDGPERPVMEAHGPVSRSLLAAGNGAVDKLDTYEGSINIGNTELVAYVSQGNVAYRSGRFDEAIHIYGKALLEKPKDPIILSNRSAAYAGLSKTLKEIPPLMSELRPLSGLDPLTVAQLALKDADNVIRLCVDWAKGYLRRGTALALLERYEEAREAFLEGLQIDGVSIALQKGLRGVALELDKEARVDKDDVDGRQSGDTAQVRTLGRSEDLDCVLCLKLLYNPVTVPCGHSFCRNCLVQAMDHNRKCPMCRVVLLISPFRYPISLVLKNIIEKNFPEEYAERAAESSQQTVGGLEVLPLFVMDIILPGQRMGLNIFEPRYRLMVRRAMEGNHRFAMAQFNPETNNPAEIACEAEIKECDPQLDGRFLLEIEGKRRCKIIRSWDQDGYRIAQIEWYNDKKHPEDSPEFQQVEARVEVVGNLLNRMAPRSNRMPERMNEILRQIGNPNSRKNKEEYSFWVANLLNLTEEDRYNIFQTDNTMQRLDTELAYLRGDRQTPCRIQ